jgi:hypothetical protein
MINSEKNIKQFTRKLPGISTNFAVDLDQSLFHNCLDFLGGQSVLQAVSQEN